MQNKYEQLKEILKSYGSVAVAFSGGVDSTFLLYAAKEVLGEKVLAITATPRWVPEREQKEAVQFCEKNEIRHVTCKMSADEIAGFRKNPYNRCYLCKKFLFSKMTETARENGFTTLIEGSNVDDERDFRPGMAALEEINIKSPLRLAELTKEEIRSLSGELKLPTWNKPAFACLASRFVYGETITDEKLQMVEQAEDYLAELGFQQFRVRIHGLMARIEVPKEDFQKAVSAQVAESIHKRFKELGFFYVSLDLGGYRMGSMNETIK